MIHSLLVSLATMFTQQSPQLLPPRPPAPIVTQAVPGRSRYDFQKAIDAGNSCRRAFIGQNYFPQPAIWKITNGDSRVYLFGTIHMLPVAFEWRTAQLDQIIGEARLLVTETGIPADPNFFSTALLATGTRAAGGRTLPIAERLKGERRAKWIGMAAMLPEELSAKLDSGPSWLAALTVAWLPDATKAPRMTRGADAQLEQLFKAKNKPIAAIEEFQPILASIAEIPEGQQLDMLTQAVDAIGQHRTLSQRMQMFHDWARGIPTPNEVQDARMSQIPESLRERLLNRRNAAWVAKVQQRMKEPGTTLIAVGAAHLRGPGSLIELLAQQGIKAERVSPVTPPRGRPAFTPTPNTWQTCNNVESQHLISSVRRTN